MAHRVGEVAGLHLVLLLDDRGPRLAVRNLLRRRLDCELGILEQPGKSGRAHVEVVGALAARVDEGEVVRVIVGVAVPLLAPASSGVRTWRPILYRRADLRIGAMQPLFHESYDTLS